MTSDLVFEYAHDWRMHALMFRHGGGAKALAVEGWRRRAAQWFWIGLLGYSAYVANRFAQTPLLVLATGALLWRVSYACSLVGLARRAAWIVRISFRERPAKFLRLVVTSTGLRDHDTGIESIAPWSAIRSFRTYKGGVIIELANGLAACIPKKTLSCASPPLEALLCALREQGVEEQPGGCP